MPDPTQNPDSGEHPDPWETHAAWWQEQFTDGVDPEYTEQILPLIAAHLPEGADRVTGLAIDVGSTNGTTVNLERLEPMRPKVLADEDILTLGRYSFQLLSAATMYSELALLDAMGES